MASIPLEKVMPFVTQVSFSAFSRSQDDREGLRRGVLRALESVSLLAFPTFLGMALVAPEAIAVFLGPKWAAAVIPFQILCLVLPFRALGLLFAPALFGAGQSRVAVENNAITLGGVAAALIVGVQWGVVGLCLGWLVGYVPVFWVTAYRSLTTLQVPFAKFVSAMRLPLAGTLAMGVGVVVARPFVVDALSPAAALPCLSLLGSGIYGALMAAFRPEPLRLLWRLRVGK